MNFYTLQITFGQLEKPEVIELKDLHPQESVEEKKWMAAVREKLFTTGFQVMRAPGSIEFISPFFIHKVFLLKQDRQFAPPA